MHQGKEHRMSERVAVITGGAQGIGFGIAARFAEEGADVLLANLKIDTAKASADRIRSAGGKATALEVDIGDDSSVAELATAVDALHGRCEILVNNAAISDSSGIQNMTMKRYYDVI